MQQGQNKLIGFASKSLPRACVNYGITELEMTGLMVNMENWKFYLGRKDFDAVVDHRAIPYIMKSKELPTTDRIIKILQRLGRFNFHLYYVKGKDMILCDFLSRVNVDDSDLHNLIPIAFHQMELEPLQFNIGILLQMGGIGILHLCREYSARATIFHRDKKCSTRNRSKTS